MKNVDKRITIKISIIIVLIALILFSLVLLAILPAKSNTVVEPAATATPNGIAVVTPTPITEGFDPEPTPTATAEPTPEPTPVVDTGSNESMQRVVSSDNPIPADYVPSDLVTPNVTMNGDQQLRQEAATALEQMFAAAEADGIGMRLLSGYRSYEYQNSLYNTYVAKYGATYANRIDSRPGLSEHQLGLAVDLSDYYGDCANQVCFEQYATCTWLRRNAYKFGFVMSYQYGAENITGVRYSPWHWRYVGVEEATKIFESDQTMTQYYSEK